MHACRRFTAWLGQNSSQGKQRRLLGELHTRMTSSGHLSSDRIGLRTSYLPALRYVLINPLATLDKEGIPEVIETMSVSISTSSYTLYTTSRVRQDKPLGPPACLARRVPCQMQDSHHKIPMREFKGLGRTG